MNIAGLTNPMAREFKISIRDRSIFLGQTVKVFTPGIDIVVLDVESRTLFAIYFFVQMELNYL